MGAKQGQPLSPRPPHPPLVTAALAIVLLCHCCLQPLQRGRPEELELGKPAARQGLEAMEALRLVVRQDQAAAVQVAAGLRKVRRLLLWCCARASAGKCCLLALLLPRRACFGGGLRAADGKRRAPPDLPHSSLPPCSC